MAEGLDPSLAGGGGVRRRCAWHEAAHAMLLGKPSPFQHCEEPLMQSNMVAEGDAMC